MTQRCARTNPTNAIVKNACGYLDWTQSGSFQVQIREDHDGSVCLDLRQEEFDMFSAELRSAVELGGSESEYESSVLQSQL